nr:hypothetical protein [Tanacetum cinerariifolium]
MIYQVAILEAEQIKLATKRSKKDFHISHASGSDNGVDTQSKILNEQQQKTFGTDEGTGTIPGVLDVPPYESEKDVNERVCIPSDDTEITNEEKHDNEEIMDDEEDDKVIKEMYDDVNVNLGNDDT